VSEASRAEHARLLELINVLTELVGPSGEEGPVLDAVTALWTDAGLDVERSPIGNLVGRAGGQGPRLLLAAHADELCYFVRAIDPAGYLWLANGQAWTRTTSLRNAFTIGAPVQVLARRGPLPGYIATVTGHMASLVLREPAELTWNDFWVDTGLTRDELLAQGVTAGTRVVWQATTRRVGRHLVGKAFDDRVALAVITEVVRRVPAAERRWELALAATVQEEIGVIGASALAARERFAAAIVVETGLTGDVPQAGDTSMPIQLGAGPTLVHKDSLVHYDHALTCRLERAAAHCGVAIQHAVFGSFGSDGAAFMKADIPAAMVAFPTRYTHTPFETVDERDVAGLVDWLCAFVRGQGDLSA
jgi:tetrahedral aminopeptidase